MNKKRKERIQNKILEKHEDQAHDLIINVTLIKILEQRENLKNVKLEDVIIEKIKENCQFIIDNDVIISLKERIYKNELYKKSINNFIYLSHLDELGNKYLNKKF